MVAIFMDWLKINAEGLVSSSCGLSGRGNHKLGHPAGASSDILVGHSESQGHEGSSEPL